MSTDQYTPYNDQEYDPIVFHDGRGDDDSSLMSDSLDCYSLSIDALD